MSPESPCVDGVDFYTPYHRVKAKKDPGARPLSLSMAYIGKVTFNNDIGGAVIDCLPFQPHIKMGGYTLNDIFVGLAPVSWWKVGAMHLDGNQDWLSVELESATSVSLINILALETALAVRWSSKSAKAHPTNLSMIWAPVRPA